MKHINLPGSISVLVNAVAASVGRTNSANISIIRKRKHNIAEKYSLTKALLSIGSELSGKFDVTLYYSTN